MVKTPCVTRRLLFGGALCVVSLGVSSIADAAGSSRTLVPVAFPSSGGPTVVNCVNAPYLASGSGEAAVRVKAAQGGEWRVRVRLKPGNLTLVHPTGATFAPSAQAVDRERLVSSETQTDLELPLTFVGPNGLPSLNVVFVLRVMIDANGQPTVAIVGAPCSPNAG